MLEGISCDVVIVGSGLAGLRAAIEAAKTDPKMSITVLSKVQSMRSHSVSAEGGTAASLYTDEGDSFEAHQFDTVKGSDYLADQNVVELFVRSAPTQILQLEHWGMPWTRRKDGKIAQRPFGGHSYPRATFAEDKVGFFEMSTLYDTAQKFDNITFNHEWFVTSIIVDDGLFQGFTAIRLKTGNLGAFTAKAGILATGGTGRLYGFTTYGHSSTPEGMALALRAGIPLQDMELVQFHPTGLVPSGILITEAARGEGGYLKNSNNERLMKKYAPEKMELAPRDIISRSVVKEIEEGRSVEGPNGFPCINLDLTHLGHEKILKRLPGIRDICLKLAGIDPENNPIPIRPVAHYTMGGVEADISGSTKVKGLWVAGEVSCVGLHGANRLGSNSTAECLVWGTLTGEAAAKFVSQRVTPVTHKDVVIAEEKRIFDKILGKKPEENPYDIRHEIRETMDRSANVFRTEAGLAEGLKNIRRLKSNFSRGVQDTSRIYNTNLTDVLELEAMLDVAEVMLISAYAREESRGAHSRRDFPERDDVNWLKHTLVNLTPAGLKVEYKPVVIEKWKPTERKY